MNVFLVPAHPGLLGEGPLNELLYLRLYIGPAFCEGIGPILSTMQLFADMTPVIKQGLLKKFHSK